MNNEKWTKEVKNNKDLIDGLEDCEIIDDTILEIKDKKDSEISITYVEQSIVSQDEESINQNEIKQEEIKKQNTVEENPIQESVVDEQIIDKSIIEEETITENSIGEETSTEEIVNENSIDEETLTEEVANENPIDEETLTEETVTENPIDEVTTTEEIIEENEINKDTIDVIKTDFEDMQKLTPENNSDEIEQNNEYEDKQNYQEEDDDGLLFLSKNKCKDEKENDDKLSIEKKIEIQDIINEQEARKKEEINLQNSWGKDLGEFPVEKNKKEENNQNQEEEIEKTESEEIESIIPISPEVAVDTENTDFDIVKPKDFSELVSAKGEILENYISGDSKFKSISDNLTICIELCKLFASIHSIGYCFNGLTANDIVITKNRECKLISDEKIVSQNDDDYQINYEKTCAPEILKNESRPNINSDKYTMAFLIFGLLFKSNPFEGRKMLNTVIYTKEDELEFYKEPVFVYSHKEKDNNPVYGIHSVLIKYWNRFYSESIKMIFKESFVEGINDPEARVEDKTFIEKLIGFKNIVDSKNTKKEPTLEITPKSNLEKTKQILKEGISVVKDHKKYQESKEFEEKKNIIEINKDAAKKTVQESKINYALRVEFSYTEGSSEDCTLINLNPGVEIKNTIVGYDGISNENIIGKVIQNAKYKDIIGLKNLSDYTWLATKGEREQKQFPPGKVIVISEGVIIDFYPENKSKSKSKWSIVKA